MTRREFWLCGVRVFLLNVLLGAVWAGFTRSVALSHALQAAGFDGLIVAVAATNTFAYIKSRSFFPFVLAGSVLGTYLAVAFAR